MKHLAQPGITRETTGRNYGRVVRWLRYQRS